MPRGRPKNTPIEQGYKKQTGFRSPFGEGNGGIDILTLNGEYCITKRTHLERLVELAELSGERVPVTWFNPMREGRGAAKAKTMTAGAAS